MSANVASRTPGTMVGSLFSAFRPRPRFRELGLLVLVAATLLLGSLTAGASLAARPVLDAGQIPGGVDLRMLDSRALAAYVAGLLAVPQGPGLGVAVDDAALAEVLVEELDE